jgi:Fe-S cluster assembly iron-binding protein IscA
MHMLTLSDQAATVLTESRSQQGIPEDALLRVAGAQQGQEQGITLGFVDQPQEGDQTGDAHGLGICVAPEVAAQLDAAKIDIDQSGDQPQLVLVPAEAG